MNWNEWAGAILGVFMLAASVLVGVVGLSATAVVMGRWLAEGFERYGWRGRRD